MTENRAPESPAPTPTNAELEASASRKMQPYIDAVLRGEDDDTIAVIMLECGEDLTEAELAHGERRMAEMSGPDGLGILRLMVARMEHQLETRHDWTDADRAMIRAEIVRTLDTLAQLERRHP